MSIRSDLLEFVKKIPRQKIHIGTLAGEFGYDHRQIQQTMNWLIKHDKLPGLKVHTQGQIWIYKPEGQEYVRIAGQDFPVEDYSKPPGDINPPHGWTGGMGKLPLLKAVHKTERGAVVLEDDQGFLWIAQRASSQ